MTKFAIFGMAIAMLLALSSWQTAGAEFQGTQTPLGTFAFSTATQIPPRITPTALPACPGSPVGDLGGLDPAWLASCSHCVSTVTPTSQYVIGTAPAGDVTPTTPSSTATSSPSATPMSEWALHFESSVGGSYPASSAQFTMDVDPQVAGRIVGMVVSYSSNPSAQQARSLTSAEGYSPFTTWWGEDLTGRSIVIWTPAVLYTTLNDVADRAAFVGERGWLSWTGAFGEFWVPGQEAGYIGMWIAQLGPGFPSIFQPIGYVYFGEPLETEPTPTPGAISCLSPAYRNEDPVVDYGGFDQLGSTCYVLIPGFSFTIPSIFGLNEEFSLAADTYQLCVQWYSFPQLAILDISIPIDLVILPAAVWLFRRFMEF